ncbi:MAG: rhodanese-like domain-containing protein [Planctomycetota bacterium]|nr:rhodanese-like domain-containing protein [Planctomycetota bacterium]
MDTESPQGAPEGVSRCSGSLWCGVATIVVFATVLAFATNSLRPSHSIHLGRDYFNEIPAVEIDNGSEVIGVDTEPDSGDPPMVEPDDGIQRLSFEEARDNFYSGEDEFEASGESIYLFVDARDRDLYEERHIPGAVWLHHYESEQLIEDLRPELEMAFFVIVYCNGGDCEDSLHLAADLSSLYGIPTENIYVFEGGLNEWVDNEMPVVSGSERR